MSNKRFGVQVELIKTLAELGAEDAQKIEELEKEREQAINLISALVAKYGKPDPLFPKRRTLSISSDELFDAPKKLARWDDWDTDELVFGVTVDE